jgi:hypothetical protein
VNVITSAFGTYQTCRTKLTMSVDRSKADLAVGAHRGPEVTLSGQLTIMIFQERQMVRMSNEHANEG